jgi:hypothetical protein
MTADAANRSLGRSLLKATGWLILLIAIALVAAWIWARPAAPDSFAEPDGPVPAAPGRLLKQEPFTKGVPPGTRAVRILYTTTRQNGAPALATALVYLPAAAATAPRPVVAWAHGTTGIAPGCAPSLAEDPLANVPAVPQALARGWALVATDYSGLGTSRAPQGHAYIIGDDAARAVLDSVRAARQLAVAALGPQTLIWGHSQGGNSALWTGIAAPAYAPDVPLAGIAAMAPASDLPGLLEASAGSLFGKIVSAFLAHSYARTYADVVPDAIIRPAARFLAADIASRCINGRPGLVCVAETVLLPADGIFEPGTAAQGPFARRLAENVPRGPFAAPLFIAQGDTDDLVLPRVQASYVAARCAAGQPLLYRRYAGLDHLSLVAPASPLTDDLIAWSADRLAGRPAPANCPPAG